MEGRAKVKLVLGQLPQQVPQKVVERGRQR